MVYIDVARSSMAGLRWSDRQGKYPGRPIPGAMVFSATKGLAATVTFGRSRPFVLRRAGRDSG